MVADIRTKKVTASIVPLFGEDNIELALFKRKINNMSFDEAFMYLTGKVKRWHEICEKFYSLNDEQIRYEIGWDRFILWTRKASQKELARDLMRRNLKPQDNVKSIWIVRTAMAENGPR